jgi:predicted O-methyltransferase YrrM
MAFDFEAFLKNNKSKGLTSEEWLALSRYAAACKEGAIVEIGSFRGNSAMALGHGVVMSPEQPGARVFCVEPHEPFTGIYGGKFGPQDRGEFYRKMLDTGFFDRIALINLRSAEAAAGWTRPIGLLFIDGDHSLEGVRRDAELWLPRLIVGGIVAFDDAKDPSIGPSQVAEDLIGSGRWELVEEVGKILFLRKSR